MFSDLSCVRNILDILFIVHIRSRGQSNLMQSHTGETVSPRVDLDVATTAQDTDTGKPSSILTEEESGKALESAADKTAETQAVSQRADSKTASAPEVDVVNAPSAISFHGLNANTKGDKVVENDLAAALSTPLAFSPISDLNVEDDDASDNETVDFNSLMKLYEVGELIEFHDKVSSSGTWLSAVVTKRENKPLSATDKREVPHYELQLKEGKQDIIKDAYAFELRIPLSKQIQPASEKEVSDDLTSLMKLYAVKDRVEFHDKDGGGDDAWLSAVVVNVEFKPISATDSRKVPHYDLELLEGKRDLIQDACAIELRFPASEAQISREDNTSNNEDGLVDINLMLSEYAVGEHVQFRDAEAGDDAWLPAVVKKIEYKAVNETDSRQVPHYEVELTEDDADEIVEDVLAFDLRLATEEALDDALPKHDVYETGEQVEFFYEDPETGGSWVTAVVLDVDYRPKDEMAIQSDEDDIPHYKLKLVESERLIENVFGEAIREDITPMMVPTYAKGEEVEFHFADEETWHTAVVEQVAYKPFSEKDFRQVPFYRLQLKENGQFVPNVLADQMRVDIAHFPVFAAGEKVEYLDHDSPGKQAWVTAVVKKMEFKTIGDSNRPVPHYDVEITNSDDDAEEVEDVLGDALREDITQMLSPVYEMGERVEFRGDGGAWLPAVVEQVGYVTISETDQRLVPWYNLLIDNEFVKHSFANQLRRVAPSSSLQEHTQFLHSGQQNLGHLRITRRASFDGSHSQFTHANHHEDVFTIGDRVEVLYKHSWQPGTISRVKKSVTGTRYSVWYDHMSSDKDIAQARVRGIFGQLGVRISVLNSERNSKWGIVAGWDRLVDSPQTGHHNSYHVLTKLDAPLEVMQSAPQNVIPVRDEFEQHETVEVLMGFDDNKTKWQRATVQDVDKDTMTYTLKAGNRLWKQQGDFIRPYFMVGNFVWVLHHSITGQRKLRVLKWVLGVLVSITPVVDTTEGAENVGEQSHEYVVWRLDKGRIEEGNMIKVSMPQCIFYRNQS